MARRLPLSARAVLAVLLLAGIGALWIAPLSGKIHLLANLAATYLLLWGMVLLFTGGSYRDRATRFVLTSLVLVLGLLALEALAFAGLVDFQKLLVTSKTDPWLRSGNRFDPELAVVRRPHLEQPVTRARGNIADSWCLPASGPVSRYTIHYDANGFRNPEDLERADVAVVGDSYVEAVGLPDDLVMTSLLSERLGGPVANLGLSGYGPQQELAVLERYALPLEPGVVFWMFYGGNDLRDLMNYQDFLSRLDDRGRYRYSRRARSFTRNLIEFLHATERALRCEPHPLSERRYGVFGGTGGGERRMYFVDPGRPLGEAEEGALLRLGEVLRSAGEATRARGSSLVVVYVPSKFRIYHDLLQYPPSSECPSWTLNELPKRLAELVREVAPGTGFLDLTPHFRDEAARRGEPLYFLDDTHWNAAGQRLVADRLASYLEEKEAAVSGP